MAVVAWNNLGCVSIQRQDVDAAEHYFNEAIKIGRLYPASLLGPSSAIMGLGYVAVHGGDYRRGGLLVGFSEANRKRQGVLQDPK